MINITPIISPFVERAMYQYRAADRLLYEFFDTASYLWTLIIEGPIAPVIGC